MKNNKSLNEVKKIISATQDSIEMALKKQLIRFDKIKDAKERNKAKETFLLAYQSVFNDSVAKILKGLK